MNYLLIMLVGWGLSTPNNRIKPFIAVFAGAWLFGVIQPLQDSQVFLASSLKEKARYYADKYCIDFNLFQALITQESNWDPEAESIKGARGLGQVMPANAMGCGLEPDDLWNVDHNLDCSAKLLKEALVYWDQQFPNDVNAVIKHALAEYNAGRNAVRTRSALTQYPETRNYVARVLSLYQGGLTDA